MTYEPESLDWSFTYRVRDAAVALKDGSACGMRAERIGDVFAVRSTLGYNDETYAAVLLGSLDFDPPVRARDSHGGAS